jgi:large repetitive protein
VSAGDLDGDGVNEIVTGPGIGGGPAVGVWKLTSGAPVLAQSFLALEAEFRGGVTVACGLGADGQSVIVIGAGPGGGPRVRTFDARTLDVLADVFAFNPDFTGGVYVASGDVLGTGQGTQIVAGPGLGGGPRLRVLGLDGTALADTFAAVDTLRDGLTVATLARAGRPSSVLVGAGQGAFTGDLSEGALGGLAPVGFFEVGFEGGVFVG